MKQDIEFATVRAGGKEVTWKAFRFSDYVWKYFPQHRADMTEQERLDNLWACRNLQNNIVVQFKCTQNEVMIKDKEVKLLNVAWIGLGMCSFYLIAMYFLLKYFQALQIEWDDDNLTASDYTAEFENCSYLYNDFMNKPDQNSYDLHEF